MIYSILVADQQRTSSDVLDTGNVYINIPLFFHKCIKIKGEQYMSTDIHIGSYRTLCIVLV